MDSLLCRAATANDIDVVAYLDGTDEHMGRQPRNTRLRLLGKATAGDLHLALRGDVVVGYARVDMLWPESCPLLAWMYVTPMDRGHGTYRALREHVRSALADEGFTSMLVSACDARPAMVQRFLDRGLTPQGSLRFENGVVETFFWEPLTGFTASTGLENQR